MFSSLMEPTLRPTIIVVLDETGDRVNSHLLNLTPSLDPLITRAMAIVRYQGDDSSSAERRAVVEPGGDEDEALDADAIGSGMGDPEAPWTVLETGVFTSLMVRAICDVQDVRVLERLRRAGVKTPDALAQIVVVGRADSPVLGEALLAVRAALAAAAHELGATIRLDAPILCALADYAAATTTPSFSDYVGGQRGYTPVPEDVSALRDDYLDLAGPRVTEDGADDGASNGAAAYDDLRRRAQDADARRRGLAAQAAQANGNAAHHHLPPATFQFLYSRVVQDRRATLGVDLVDYIMAEAIFCLAATGVTFAASMAEVARSTPAVSATKDRLGSLGACLVRFPRSEVEKYCLMSLGAELLAYWGERERAAANGTHDDEMRDKAFAFVTDVLTPWIRGDLLDDRPPDAGPDDWPDTRAFSEETLKAGAGLAGVSDQMADLIDRNEINRLIDSRDPDGEERRRPERFANLWKDVTNSQWLEYDDVRRAQWNVAAGRAYTAVGNELNHHLDHTVDDIWLDSQFGWSAAKAYVEELSAGLYKTTLESFADDRIRNSAEYEHWLRYYEELIQEAYEDQQTVNPNDPEQGALGPETYEARFGNDATYFANQPGGAAITADVYNPPNADPLMNGIPDPAPAPGAGVTPGSVDDETLAGAATNADPNTTPGDAAGAQPAVAPDAGVAQPEPPTREEREDAIIQGMADLVVKRQLDRRMIWPAIGVMLVAAPVLTLLALGFTQARWPLSPLSVAVVTGGVCLALAVSIVALWFRARIRANEALDQHIACLALVGKRRRMDVEERLRVFVINEALRNSRLMRDHLENWPRRIQEVATQLRDGAQETSDKLFNGPSGYHDILIAFGERLRAPEEPDDSDDYAASPDGAKPAVESPLRRIYERFSRDRARNPIEPWHSSLDGILDELRASFRAGNGGVIRMSDAEFRRLLLRFLRSRFRVYLRSEMGRLDQALDPGRNPEAPEIWMEAREHAAPPYGAPGADMLYITGQRQTLVASASLGEGHTTQRIKTREVTRHKEWLETSRLRRGGILL